jgi:hypothetical protein
MPWCELPTRRGTSVLLLKLGQCPVHDSYGNKVITTSKRVRHCKAYCTCKIDCAGQIISPKIYSALYWGEARIEVNLDIFRETLCWKFCVKCVKYKFTTDIFQGINWNVKASIPVIYTYCNKIYSIFFFEPCTSGSYFELHYVTVWPHVQLNDVYPDRHLN